jgi:uncharacterized protein with von Willebrand factor type A (vWA) domain
MDSNDLLKMLDLGGEPPARADPTATPVVSSSCAAPPPAASPTALVVDAWGLRRGRELFAEAALGKLGLDELAAADFFGAAFDPDPRLAPACTDPARGAFVAALLGSPDYRALHADTQLDDTAAEIAAVAFAKQFAAAREDECPKPGDASGAGTEAAETAGGPPAPGGDLAAEVATLRAAARAVSEARSGVEELRDATAALGMGPGSPGSNDPARIAEIYKRVRGDPALKRICELAGRFRRVAQSRQRQKARHGADEVVGVEPGGDLGRVLPSELMKLAVPELELDTLRRLAERQLLCRELRSVEPVGKGPIVVCTDESGSMEGEKAHAAKALALALAWVARRQRRWAGLVAYSGDSGERLLALPPGKWDEGKLADWLAAFIGHGSDLDVPLRELPRMYSEIGAPKGVTDVVLVTDCRCRVPAAVRDAFLAWKKSVTARVLTLVVGDSPGDLAQVSDEVYRVASLEPGGDEVGRVLSL